MIDETSYDYVGVMNIRIQWHAQCDTDRNRHDLLKRECIVYNMVSEKENSLGYL